MLRESSQRDGYTEAHLSFDAEQRYRSGLTDAEWSLVKDLFENEGGRGKLAEVSRRDLVDACCYVVRTGCSWRMLPRAFPPWHNVYKTFRRWSAQGKFERMHDRLRELWRQRERRDQGRSAVVLDAQSTRSLPQGGPSGYAVGKKVKARKRSLVVDTRGLLLAVSVAAANLQDRDAGMDAVQRAAAKYPSVETLFVDSAYGGKCAQRSYEQHGLAVDVVRPPENRTAGRWHNPSHGELFEIRENADGFVPLPKRWFVERTHGWDEWAHRLIVHHDVLPEVSAVWVWLASAPILMRRLTAV